jgi:hypothetical protein
MHSELEKKIVQKILKKMQFGHTRCEDLLVETLGNDIPCIAEAHYPYHHKSYAKNIIP